MFSPASDQTPALTPWLRTDRAAIDTFVSAVTWVRALAAGNLDFGDTLTKLIEVFSCFLIQGIRGIIASEGRNKVSLPWTLDCFVGSSFVIIDTKVLA